MPDTYTLIVDCPQSDLLTLELRDPAGTVRGRSDVRIHGHVDNLLLTAVDELLKKSSLDRSALTAALLGAGIDKNSSLCRIVQSFAAAIEVASRGLGGTQEPADPALPRGSSAGSVN